ncbi:MAG: hypothetical protein V1701_02635 [Planctomycetota bacterium]
MGMNYYLKGAGCPCCANTRGIHLGKSSAGWKFRLQYDEDKYKNWDEMKSFISQPGTKITDECGDEIPISEFVGLVEGKQSEIKPNTEDLDKYREYFLIIDGYYFSREDFS